MKLMITVLGMMMMLSITSFAETIGFVDVQKVFVEYKETEKAKKDFEEKQAKLREEMEEKQKLLQKAEEDNKSPEELQKLVMEVGAEVGALATNTILDAGESTLKKFAERGGIITELSGAEKSKFDAMMTDKVMPAMADMFDKEVLLAAEAFAK